MSSFDKLYDEVIKKHAGDPYHFKKLPECRFKIEAYNFICGDKFDVCMDWQNSNTIGEIHFHGFGCAVSKSSTSIMAQVLEGKSKDEALKVCDQFLRLLKKELRHDEELYSKDFNSFRAVQEIQSRYDCAALPWIEMVKFLTVS